MRIALSVRGTDGQPRSFLVDADPETAVGDVLRRAGAVGTAAATGHESVWVGGRSVDPDLSLHAAGIRNGALLELRNGDPALLPASGLLDVGIASGPGTGSVVRLGPGEHIIGAASGLPALPRRAVILQVALGSQARVRAASVDVTVELGGAPLRDAFTPWHENTPLIVAGSLLQLRPVTDAEAVLTDGVDGGTSDFNRPPRSMPARPDGQFRIPAPPPVPPRNPLPWVGALVPVVGALVTAVAFHSFAFLAIAALTPLIAVGNALAARRRGQRGHRAKTEDYEATVARIKADIEARNAQERGVLLATAPSAVELGRIAAAPESRLWERRPADDDHLTLRVGTADATSELVIEDLREELEYRRRLPAILHDVPLTIPLGQAGVVGLAGEPEDTRPVAEWLLAQLAVLQSPRDVQLFLLTATERPAEWEWATWLPHLAPALGQDARTLVGNDAETIGRRVAELARLLSDRQLQAAAATGRRLRFAPDVVVLWEGARRLRSYPGVAAILRDGPAVGIYGIVVDKNERSLPEETIAVVTVRADGGADVRRAPQDVNTKTRLDVIDQAWFERVGRALAPVRDAGNDDDALPDAARLTEVMQLEPVGADGISARWADGARTTRAMVGVSLDGPFSIDLVTDGPHGLIAGTTGAGKSELLQTLVASLAVANRPDAMNFVLVDYKGGAAFKDAVRLPHTVGMVTDLDAHLVERALTSLGAELTRREHILAGAGAKDIDDYLEAREKRGGEPLPRLLIVIDEFASMVRELPDFVTGLVNIAQRGRSLGIHLILATQRPSGIVSGEIRANTNLRIALRVTDAGDSSDIIGTSDAAQISASTPGRAYARLGHASLIPFQTARVGGRSPVAGTPRQASAPVVTPLSWASAGYPLPAPPRPNGGGGEVTDLGRIVDAAREAHAKLEVPPNHSPWLPPLPASMVSAQLPPARSGDGDAAIPAVSWALGDQPAEQAQRPVSIDVATFGHLYIAGSARTGRSQALRTIAGRLADAVSAADLHLFGIDMGNGALLPLTRLPHTGAVVQRNERDRLARLFDRLQSELTRRQELFARLGVADIGEQRRQATQGERLPHLLVMLDRWENFTSTFGDVDGGALIEQVLTFLREGAGAGLHLVLAGDRSLLSGRISVLTEDKWALRFADRGDYTMADLNPRKLPDQIPDGRMLRASTGQEAQIALLDPDPSATAQAAALAEIATRAGERDRAIPSAQRPMRIDLLPTALTWDESLEYPAEPHNSPMWALLGVGGDRLTALGVDLANGAPSFLLAGPPRSGRSNLLAVMARSLLDAGTDVVLMTPRRSPLQALIAGKTGVRATFDGTAITRDELQEVLEKDAGPVVLIVDDGELVRDIPGADYLREWLRGATGDRAIVLGGNAAEVGGGFAGWQTDIRNNQRGALLSPRNMFDGDLLGARVSRSVVNGPVTPGRVLVRGDGGELQTLQVPRLVE